MLVVPMQGKAREETDGRTPTSWPKWWVTARQSNKSFTALLECCFSSFFASLIFIALKHAFFLYQTV